MVFPVLFIIIFTWIRSLYGETEESRLYTYEYQPEDFRSCVPFEAPLSKIVYSPQSSWIEIFLQTVLNEDETLEFEAFADANAMDVALNSYQSRKLIGIEFEDSLNETVDRPNILRYKLRYPGMYSDNSLSYCFQPLQNLLEKGFINTFDGAIIPDIFLKQFRYSRSFQDDFTSVLKFLLPVVLIFSTYYTVTKIIKVKTLR